jgi:hypothetical protein
VFDRLFKDPHALVRHRNGPLAEDRRRYLIHCAEQPMALRTLLDIAIYTLDAANALRLAERLRDLIPRDEIEAAANRRANRYAHQPVLRTGSSSWRRFIRYATRWIAFLGRLPPPAAAPQRYADLVTGFADHMRQERGLRQQAAPRTPHAISTNDPGSGTA